MSQIPTHLRVKFGQHVWHDQPYLHPHLKNQEEQDFFDRHAEKQKANEFLWFPGTSKPIVLVGERRAGKSSVLELLLHALEGDPRFVCVNIPWGRIDSAQKLVQELLYAVYFKLDLEDRSLQQAFKEIHTTAEFLGVLKKVMDGVPNKTIVIVIDELDSIIIEQVTSESQKREILSLISTLAESEALPVKLVLAMSREPSKIETGYGSLLTSKSETIYLKPFPRLDLDNMIRGIVRQDILLSEDDLERIYALSGGWPYYAKALLYFLVQLPGEKQLEQAKERAIKDSNLSGTLLHIYEKHWDASERTIILLIAKREGHISEKEMQVVDPSIKAAARELVSRGYLLEMEGGYRFRIGLLQEWFLQWPRFEEQTKKYLKDILAQLERVRNRWIGGEEEIIQVSQDDVRRRGFVS